MARGIQAKSYRKERRKEDKKEEKSLSAKQKYQKIIDKNNEEVVHNYRHDIPKNINILNEVISWMYKDNNYKQLDLNTKIQKVHNIIVLTCNLLGLEIGADQKNLEKTLEARVPERFFYNLQKFSLHVSSNNQSIDDRRREKVIDEFVRDDLRAIQKLFSDVSKLAPKNLSNLPDEVGVKVQDVQSLSLFVEEQNFYKSRNDLISLTSDYSNYSSISDDKTAKAAIRKLYLIAENLSEDKFPINIRRKELPEAQEFINFRKKLVQHSNIKTTLPNFFNNLEKLVQDHSTLEQIFKNEVASLNTKLKSTKIENKDIATDSKVAREINKSIKIEELKQNLYKLRKSKKYKTVMAKLSSDSAGFNARDLNIFLFSDKPSNVQLKQNNIYSSKPSQSYITIESLFNRGELKKNKLKGLDLSKCSIKYNDGANKRFYSFSNGEELEKTLGKIYSIHKGINNSYTNGGRLYHSIQRNVNVDREYKDQLKKIYTESSEIRQKLKDLKRQINPQALRINGSLTNLANHLDKKTLTQNDFRLNSSMLGFVDGLCSFAESLNREFPNGMPSYKNQICNNDKLLLLCQFYASTILNSLDIINKATDGQFSNIESLKNKYSKFEGGWREARNYLEHGSEVIDMMRNNPSMVTQMQNIPNLRPITKNELVYATTAMVLEELIPELKKLQNTIQKDKIKSALDDIVRKKVIRNQRISTPTNENDVSTLALVMADKEAKVSNKIPVKKRSQSFSGELSQEKRDNTNNINFP